MAEKDNTPVTEFDPSLPPTSLTGLEYFIPGIKESSVKRAAFCMLVTERAHRISNGERKIVVDLLFKAAFEKLLQGKSLECSGCGESIPWAHFLSNPFAIICDESEKCKEDLTRKTLTTMRDALENELGKLNRETKNVLRDNTDCVIGNHPGDQNRQPNISLSARIPTIKKLIYQYESAIMMHDHGKYGICIECEEPIDPARLAVSPNANRCVKCKGEIEKREGVANCYGKKVSLSHMNQVIV